MALNILNDRDVMINRELGLIQFYRRVLAQVLDENVPALERLRYLCIVTKNCDELFEVRIARLLKWEKEQPNKTLPDGLKVTEALEKIRHDVSNLYNDIYSIYQNTILPLLNKYDIYILDARQWNKEQQRWAYNYFINELKPVLTPIGIDPSHPFPRVPNKGLHFAVELDGKDQFGRESKIAIVEAPRILSRVIRLPEDLAPAPNTFVLLQDIISLHVNEFFYGMSVRGCYPFRVTRAADLTVNSDQKNLRNALTRELHNRKYAECSRLELDISNGEPPIKFIDILLKQFNITRSDLYRVYGPVNLSRLSDIASMVDDDSLKFTSYSSGLPKELQEEPDIFKAMAKGDILLHTPYQSFDPVVELTRRAAEDPHVLAVKMTVYRTGNDSELVQNLIKAARAGKQVVASIELFARFDEEANVELARQLEEAGAHVVYGVMGYKVHAKMLTIIRQ
ncbi:MAG: polyphosphate kinase 1, partial [Neisseriales bacterium]